MKRLMICITMIFFLAICQVQAVVEDSGTAPIEVPSSPWTAPASPSMPTYLPSPCYGDSGELKVTISLTGPASEPDKAYITQGNPLDFMVSVENDGNTEVESEVSIRPEGCPFGWFSWTTTTLTIPAQGSRSVSLQITPDINSVPGEYRFAAEATATCRTSGRDEIRFNVQALDYASETSVSGTGQFQLNKNLRSMTSGIRSSKDVVFSGRVEELRKNEYLVVAARGKNPNFFEEDSVEDYSAVSVGDALIGTESFKSSAVFGGVGARVSESYDVQMMEFKDQDFTLHQTGSLKKTAEFKTVDNFTGYYKIDAKQIVPGQKSLKELEEYFGSFEISRRIIFRDDTKPSTPCQDGDCPGVLSSKPSGPIGIASPCRSISCNSFIDRLNAFGK